jgi:hypothetical protein
MGLDWVRLQGYLVAGLGEFGFVRWRCTPSPARAVEGTDGGGDVGITSVRLVLAESRRRSTTILPLCSDPTEQRLEVGDEQELVAAVIDNLTLGTREQRGPTLLGSEWHLTVIAGIQ